MTINSRCRIVICFHNTASLGKKLLPASILGPNFPLRQRLHPAQCPPYPDQHGGGEAGLQGVREYRAGPVQMQAALHHQMHEEHRREPQGSARRA